MNVYYWYCAHCYPYTYMNHIASKSLQLVITSLYSIVHHKCLAWEYIFTNEKLYITVYKVHAPLAASCLYVDRVNFLHERASL